MDYLHIPVVASVFAALFAVSEVLTFIPSIKSNGVFQLAYKLLKKAVGK